MTEEILNQFDLKTKHHSDHFGERRDIDVAWKKHKIHVARNSLDLYLYGAHVLRIGCQVHASKKETCNT
jgi:hypothetical protein